MELISRISKGTNMDQVYIPKNRSGFGIGSYVVIRPIEAKAAERPCFYHIKEIEPIKLDIINKVMSVIDNTVSCDNIIITGSFLDKGFNFNDIDVIIISEDKTSKDKVDVKYIENMIEGSIGVKAHVISLDNKILLNGLSTDPLYQMMLSKCIAKKRFIFRAEHKIDYKLLDMHLLKSKTLVDNFDILGGDEKYYLIRNMIAILLYVQHKKVSKDKVDKEIEHLFNIKIKEIKQNKLDKSKFLKKYKKIYGKTFNKVMECIKHGSKQK